MIEKPQQWYRYQWKHPEIGSMYVIVADATLRDISLRTTDVNTVRVCRVRVEGGQALEGEHDVPITELF